MQHVVFAGPGHLHRRVHGFREFDGLGDEILLGATPETATEVGGVDEDLLGLQAGDLGPGHLREGLELRGGIDVTAIGAHVGRAVHGFHGGMGEEGHFVYGFHLFRGAAKRGLGIAVLAGNRAGLVEARLV